MSKKVKHIFIIDKSCLMRCDIDALNRQLKSRDFDYLLFRRSLVGKELDIVRKCCVFFRNEVLRFYACGDFRMIEGIINGLDGIKDREVAFCPMSREKTAIRNLKSNYVQLDLETFIHERI